MVGVDETGRGSWAGPLLAVAVRLRTSWSGRGLADSKRLRPSRRTELAAALAAAGEDIAFGWIEAGEIDRRGLSWAQMAAMQRAVEQLHPVSGEEIIVDGSVNYLAKIYDASRAVVQADAQYPAVMAASILAKVARDARMAELDRRYPQYGFATHKGYGTAAHQAALIARGPCACHRRSYKPVRALATRS